MPGGNSAAVKWVKESGTQLEASGMRDERMSPTSPPTTDVGHYTPPTSLLNSWFLPGS